MGGANAPASSLAGAHRPIFTSFQDQIEIDSSVELQAGFSELRLVEMPPFSALKKISDLPVIERAVGANQHCERLTSSLAYLETVRFIFTYLGR